MEVRNQVEKGLKFGGEGGILVCPSTPLLQY